MVSQRSDLLKAVAVLILICLLGLFFVAQGNRTGEREDSLAGLARRLEALEVEAAAMRAREQEILNRLEGLLEELERKEENREETWLQPWPIPLEPDLQAHTVRRARQAGIDPALVFAVMERESGFCWQDPVPDTNGYASAGYMMVNEICWDYLMGTYGVDPLDQRGNIDAGIIILYEYMQKYPVEKALVCYNCGEAGARGTGSSGYSRGVLARAEELRT